MKISVFPPRWQKIFTDLWGNRGRTLLVILSISVGVFAVGAISNIFVIVMHDIDADYQSVNPHGAIIYTDTFDDDLLYTLRTIQGVGEVEGRSSIVARVKMGPEKYLPISITTIPPLEDMHIDRLRSNSAGAIHPLGSHEIYIERSVRSELKLEPGDMITLELTDGRLRTLHLVDYVHDVSGFPYAFSGQVFSFVNQDTMKWLGGVADYNQVYLTVADDKLNEAHVKAVAQKVAEKVEKSGRNAYFTFVYKPGKHFASDIIQAILVMLGGLGMLSACLSAFLIFNTVSAILNQQIRQIGIMKSIGAQVYQLVGMYLTLVSVFGLLAFIIALPLVALASSALNNLMATMFNFNLSNFRITPLSLSLQIIVSLMVPVFAALIPVLQGTRLTAREAMSNYGLSTTPGGQSSLDRMIEGVKGLPRPLLLSIRNTFRRKSRLLLTLTTLTLGGAIFIAVFNLWASLDLTLTETFGYFLSDVNITFDRPHRIQKLATIINGVQGIVGMEGWGSSTGQVMALDKKTAVDVIFNAPPAGSKLIRPIMAEGRWLVESDENAIVVEKNFFKMRPDLKMGSSVTIKVKGKESLWKIVGIFKIAGNMVSPMVYTNYEYLSRLRNEVDKTTNLRIITKPQTAFAQKQVAAMLEKRFKSAGIVISDMQTGSDIISQNQAQTDIVVYILMIMAVLIAIVGGLGLMGTMSMNVLERTREIGVMRAIGAVSNAIAQMVIVEGVLVGVLSWALGTILAWPISLALDNALGNSLLGSPLTFIISPRGYIIWLVVVIVIASTSSLAPARSASNMTVRETLAYE